MWARALMMGGGVGMLAVGGLMLVPGAAAAAMHGARTAVAMGRATTRLAQAQMLRAAVEAVEVVEDLVAEVRAEMEQTAGTAPPDQPVVVPGRVSGAAELVLRPADLARAHIAGRRLRLRFRGAVDAAAMERVATEIGAFPGVRSVRLRPLTRTLIVETEGAAQAFAESLEAAAVVRLAAPGFSHPSAILTRALLDRLDDAIRRRSRGAQSLHSAVAMVLQAAEAIRARQRAGFAGQNDRDG